MNIVCITGRLGADPSMKATQGGTEMCTLRVAVDSGYGDKKETAWLHVIVFGKSAVNCERFLRKGSQVGVTGRISTGSYTWQDGTKATTFDIIANQVDFLRGNGGSTPKQTTEEVVQQEFNALPEDMDDVPF